MFHTLSPKGHLFSSIQSWFATQLEDRAPSPTPAGKMPALQVPGPAGGIASLDGVRAIACLIVMGYHINLMTRDAHLWQPADSPFTSALILSGGSGVTLFFVLSGFLLFLPYARALLFDTPWPAARLFYLRRALRILPGYYFSLFLLVTLEKPEYLEPQHWKELLLFVFFLMDSTQATFQQLNGPYWTLAIEWQFYLLLPLIALGIHALARLARPEWRLRASALCLLGLLVWGIATRMIGGYFQAHPAATAPIPRPALNVLLFVAYGYRGKYLEDFAVGMLAGLLYTWARSAAGTRLLRRMQRLSHWLWGAGLLLLVFTSMQNYQASFHYTWPVVSSLFALPAWTFEFGFALGFGCCILAILFNNGGLRRCFSWTPLRWIGLISYSLYIWHLPLLFVFHYRVGPSLGGLPNPLAYGLYWLWALLVVIPFCFALYRLIERPGMRLSDQLRRRMQAPLSPSSGTPPAPVGAASVPAQFATTFSG